MAQSNIDIYNQGYAAGLKAGSYRPPMVIHVEEYRWDGAVDWKGEPTTLWKAWFGQGSVDGYLNEAAAIGALVERYADALGIVIKGNE